MRLIDADGLKTKVKANVKHRVNESDYEFGCNQTLDYVADILIDEAPTVNEWTLVSDKLPKENEYVGNVRKYYLIQDEYGDMHVAHLRSCGWETIESIKALGCDVLAWMPLPEPYEVGDTE